MNEQNVMRIKEVEEMMRRVLDEQNEKALRDYFAAQAMQGIMTDATYGIDDGSDVAKISYAMTDSTYGIDDGSDVAKISYAIADAMIKQREI